MNKKSTYGKKSRVQDRKSADKKIASQVREHMSAWVPVHLPALTSPPVIHSDFEQQLALFQAFLQQQYNDIGRLRQAYQNLARMVARGNDDGVWNLNIPPTITQVPRTSTSRTENIFRYGIEAGRLYQGWKDDIQTRPAPPTSKQERLADALISAIIYGGLANPRAVVSLANLLTQNRKLIHRISDRLWIDLIWVSDVDALNVKEQQDTEEQWKTLHRFYPDNFTLGLIYSFLSHKLSYKNETAEGSVVIDGQEELNQSSVWALLKDRLLLGEQKTSFNSLQAFCTGAQSVTEMLPNVDIPQALLECASGRIKNSSLLIDQQSEWLRPATTKPVAEPDLLSFFSLAGAWRDRVIKSNDNPQVSLNTKTIDRLLYQISTALRTKRQGLKRSEAMAIEDLNELLSVPVNINAEIFIRWLQHSLLRLALSSVNRYFIELKNLWFYYTNEQDLQALDESELENIYWEIRLAKSDPKAQTYLLGRLKDLHTFASNQFGLPRLDSFFEDVTGGVKQIRVRVGYIPEHIYQAVLCQIGSIADLDDHAVDGLKVLLILAYRTGMRRGELLKLRLSDVEISKRPWLFVVNNKYGNNKTDSALRQIPLHAALLDDELEFFQNYIGARRARYPHITNTLMFSLPHSETVPYDGSMISELVKYLLIHQGCTDLTFHHLRHSALTNIMVVMDGDQELITQLTGYSIEQAKYLRETLHNARPDSRRDIYSAIAGLAGHLTPETTFTHYIHECSLLLGMRLAQHNPALDLRQGRYITGLSTRYINTQFSEAQVDAQPPATLELSVFRSEIIRRLQPHTNMIGPRNTQETVELESEQPTVSRRVANVTDCYSALRAIEQGESVAVASLRFALDEDRIMSWLRTAQALQRVKTIHGNSRLFAKNRIKTAIGLPLLPAWPKDRFVSSEIDQTINALRGLYKTNKNKLLWAVHYWLNNTSTSKQGLRFTDLEDLDTFLTTVADVLPIKRWRLKVTAPETVSDSDRMLWKYLGPKNTIVVTSASVKKIYAYLYVKHKNEKKITDDSDGRIKQYSSSLIGYVFHMLAIMIGINPEADARQAKNTQDVSVVGSAGEVVQAQVSEDVQAELLDAYSPAADSVGQQSSPSEPPLESPNKSVTGYDESSGQTILEYIQEYLRIHLNKNDL
ncbi:MAG: tyrosine-type recombinase/integrase [Pseudomonas sp.]|nr:tyrosine-type recombinase/integrase [Pseudomonas sp.]